MKQKNKLIASLKIWIVIYPSITLFSFLFGPQLGSLPLHVRTLILTVTLVPWMMFIGLPVLEMIIKATSRGKNKPL